MGHMTLVGLAKNEEEIFFPGDKQSVRLPYNSESLNLIRRIRDEVHRFGIHFTDKNEAREHLTTSWKRSGASEKIPPISFLKEFKSVKKIRELTEEELVKAVGAVEGEN